MYIEYIAITFRDQRCDVLFKYNNGLGRVQAEYWHCYCWTCEHGFNFSNTLPLRQVWTKAAIMDFKFCPSGFTRRTWYLLHLRWRNRRWISPCIRTRCLFRYDVRHIFWAITWSCTLGLHVWDYDRAGFKFRHRSELDFHNNHRISYTYLTWLYWWLFLH